MGGTKMSGFASEEYNSCKTWIAAQIQAGATWEQVKNLCVSPEFIDRELERLKYDELIIPLKMDLNMWRDLVKDIEGSYSPIVEMYGISADGNSNTLPIPTDSGSAWVRYKNSLLGKYTRKPKMSEAAVASIEKNSHWILNHIKRDTRAAGPVKGLVMGSVQSGKTANMIGLVSMAAHYDWNFIIVLSGTIDNLRKQTRDRFFDDLTQSGGVSWHILDRTSNPDYMVDIKTKERYLLEDLHLNTYQDGKTSGMWMHRYVNVCLKNSTRLRNLIKWLQAKPQRAAKLRILVIDDEADQASVNTRKMKEDLDEEEQERTAVNQLIIDLINGKDHEGAPSKAPFQAMNYISYTATPYANVLNEAYESSLYPKNFICSLPESNEYFGAKVIFGSKDDAKHTGLNIVREIPEAELKTLKLLHDGGAFTLPDEFKKSICWFLCAAAILRSREHKKPISMLIHTTALQSGHFEEYDVLKNWLIREANTGSILQLCRDVYESEKDEFTLKDLSEAYPDYGRLSQVNSEFPVFDKIETEIRILLSNIQNIMMGEDKSPVYREDGIHLCVDNCKANRLAEEGTYLRVIYPTSEQLSCMSKAPVFIVMGGNTLSRGLTIDGLVCTYFARSSNQADTLMQMARWFGYRSGYELLQRIWMPSAVRKKFELMEEIDEKLKAEFEDFMEKGRSPAQFGPKIMSTAKIAKFMLSAKNKTQNIEECEFDFSGDSYETTDFMDDQNILSENMQKTEAFLKKLGTAKKSEISDSAYIWRNVPVNTILNEFLGNGKYHIFDCSSLSADIPVFLTWLKGMNADGHYLKWNVAVSGDSKAAEYWYVEDKNIGKITRTKKKTHTPGYIDIGSLRSGRDVLCDVQKSALTPGQKLILDTAIKTGKNLISVRGTIGLEDIPLLLLYRISKDQGKDTKTREKIGSTEDVIGFSIIVPGDSIGKSHVKSVRVKIPVQ